MEEFYEISKEIIDSEIYQQMKNYIQHGTTTCYEHCIQVAEYSYRKAIKYNNNHKKQVDVRSVVRAALLHDFFLYDWHNKHERVYLFWRMHGFTHPYRALKNAKKYFEINEIEADIIFTHMWPLTLLHIPRYKESFIVMMADKRCASYETFEKIKVKIFSFAK